MTALAGYWAFGGAVEPLACCDRMLRAQQVYAPDRPATWSDGPLALGRRLFRTLPEDVHDRGPVSGGGGRWTLVADVRLDDREGLCEALGLDARVSATLADSSLVMKAIERWEEEAIGRLVGDFALALWDRDRQRLLLARDYLGARPLHYHRGKGFFAFATMPKGLFALPEIPTGPDERMVAEFLALMPQNRGASYFAAVEKVLPGELCAVTPSGLTRSDHWRFEPRRLRLKRAGDYSEAVREAFDRAVVAQLRGSGGQVAAHLSGGLDSSAVAATAARLLAPDGKVSAFTSVPREGYEARIQKGRFADEGPHAAAVAALYPNMEHVLVRTAGRSPIANLDRNFFLYEQPVLNLCNVVWSDAIMEEARSRGLKVLLTGQAGNMTFSYTGLHSLADMLVRGRWIRLAREAFLLRRHGTRLISVASHSVGPFLPARLWKAINRWAGRQLDLSVYSAVNPARAAELESEAEARGMDMAYRPSRDSVSMRLRALRRGDPGNYHKGALGGWGIDTRDPTADRRLLELCLSIPSEQYIANGYIRAVARRAFADRLPEVVLYETRKGYQAADWHEGLAAAWDSARDETERAAAVPAAAAALDFPRMAELLQAPPEGNWNAPATVARYRLALLRGVSAAHFVRKAAGSN